MCLVSQWCPTLCDSMDCSPTVFSVHGDSPGKNTGVGCPALLQGIFPTQGSNPGLSHCRSILYRVSHQGITVAGLKPSVSVTIIDFEGMLDLISSCFSVIPYGVKLPHDSWSKPFIFISNSFCDMWHRPSILRLREVVLSVMMQAARDSAHSEEEPCDMPTGQRPSHRSQKLSLKILSKVFLW